VILLQKKLLQILRRIENDAEIIRYRAVSGGCINQAFYVQTRTEEYFVKVNERMNHVFFQKEAHGLKLLQKANAIGIPNVIDVSEQGTEWPPFLVLEWIDGEQSLHTEEELGRGVATLHQQSGTHFGLEIDNYIGMLPQKNSWSDNWLAFYRDRRLKVQLELGQKKGVILPRRRQKLERLFARLDRFIPSDVTPSLIHGDLWSGNWMAGPSGRPYLIDPAVHYAHFELELAFTELFGGFSDRFYRAYAELNPLDPGYEERKPLYQLYYLLVHLNIFGETYGPAVDRILDYYL
jgi:fructosamine-3-kinase